MATSVCALWSPAALCLSALSPPRSSALSSCAATTSRCRSISWNGEGNRTGESRRGRFALRVDASSNPLGDFGARDPTPAEVESNFGDKVIGNAGTEHIILIPSSLLGLAEKSCSALAPGTPCLTEQEVTALLRKVVGWRLLKSEQGFKIWTEWNLKDFASGIKLFDRIAAVAEAEEQFPELHFSKGNKARVELSTQSVGGLSMNDFIFAAKIDKIKTSDLVKKTRFWA